MATRKNLMLIYDRDHGPENYGWYTRCDELRDDGSLLNGAVDESLGEDAGYPREDAIEDACRHFGCSPDDLTVIE